MSSCIKYGVFVAISYAFRTIEGRCNLYPSIDWNYLRSCIDSGKSSSLLGDLNKQLSPVKVIAEFQRMWNTEDKKKVTATEKRTRGGEERGNGALVCGRRGGIFSGILAHRMLNAFFAWYLGLYGTRTLAPQFCAMQSVGIVRNG